MPQLFDAPEEKPLSALGVTCAHRESAIVVDIEQGSSKWLARRCGVISASHASEIVKLDGEPTKGKTRDGYIHKLIAERLTGVVEHEAGGPACEHGITMEPKARATYKTITGRDVRQCGFVYMDDMRICGCSPDGICPDRMVEIKCPLKKQFVRLLLMRKADVFPNEYRSQMQFQMWVTGIRLNELVVFGDWPGLPIMVSWELEAEPPLHAKYTTAVSVVAAQIAAGVDAIKEGMDHEFT